MKSKKALFLKLTILTALTVLLVVGWFQRWQIHDWWKLRGYYPSQQIVQLADETTMTDYGRRLFYVYRPELNDKDSFNRNCSSSERTIVLGCYVAGQGIYVYSVTDERLKGVLQVTAAHEMLHAAYGRLGTLEKSRVDSLLESTFANITDRRIRETIEDYRNNGADITNELHSILATEVRTLPPDLEQYYSQYFKDRAVVVAYSENYEQAFTDRKNKVSAYDTQLNDLKNRIDAGQSRLETLNTQLESERARLETLLSAREYEQYNTGVNSYNASVNTYNAEVRSVRALIDEYNIIVAERNAVATEESELVKAIDSRPDTIDTE